MVTINKATASDNIFETVYDIVDAAITDPNPPASGTRKWIFSEFPDGKIDVVSGVLTTAKGVTYPLITIQPPDGEWEKLTICKNWLNVTLNFTAFHTRKAESVTLGDQIIDAIETQRAALRALKLVFVNLESVESGIEFRDEIKVHTRSIIFGMKFSFLRTL